MQSLDRNGLVARGSGPVRRGAKTAAEPMGESGLRLWWGGHGGWILFGSFVFFAGFLFLTAAASSSLILLSLLRFVDPSLLHAIASVGLCFD